MAMKPTTPDVRTDREDKMLQAIETWYTANYSTGTRMTGIERTSLAKYLAQRLGA